MRHNAGTLPNILRNDLFKTRANRKNNSYPFGLFQSIQERVQVSWPNFSAVTFVQSVDDYQSARTRHLGSSFQSPHKLLGANPGQVQMLQHLDPWIVVTEKPLPHQQDSW